LQILGRTIEDREGVEAAQTRVEALGLLEVDTRFQPRKLLYRVEAEAIAPGGLCHGCPVVGYEVHQGTSRRRAGAAPWLRVRRQPGGAVVDEGAVRGDGRVCGTYVHGLFDDARFCRALVAALRRRRGLPPLTEQDWLAQRLDGARRHARLAGWLTGHCDLRPVAAALGLLSWKT
jgi:adenosylcobyric acid synthase